MDSNEMRDVVLDFNALGNDTPRERRGTFNFNMMREIDRRESFRGIINRGSVDLAFADFEEDDYEEVK